MLKLLKNFCANFKKAIAKFFLRVIISQNSVESMVTKSMMRGILICGMRYAVCGMRGALRTLAEHASVRSSAHWVRLLKTAAMTLIHTILI